MINHFLDEIFQQSASKLEKIAIGFILEKASHHEEHEEKQTDTA